MVIVSVRMGFPYYYPMNEGKILIDAESHSGYTHFMTIEEKVMSKIFGSAKNSKSLSK